MPAKRKEPHAFEGIVVSGMAKAQSFLAQDFYVAAFRENFGFTPFAGTLNLRADEAEVQAAISGRRAVEIKGNSTSGGLKCYRALLNGTGLCILVFPEKSLRKGVAEIVSKGFLRTKFSLKDGSKVRVFVE